MTGKFDAYNIIGNPCTGDTGARVGSILFSVIDGWWDVARISRWREREYVRASARDLGLEWPPSRRVFQPG